MAQLAIKNLSKLEPFAWGPWNLAHKFHLYLIIYIIIQNPTIGLPMQCFHTARYLSTMLRMPGVHLIKLEHHFWYLNATFWHKNYFLGILNARCHFLEPKSPFWQLKRQTFLGHLNTSIWHLTASLWSLWNWLQVYLLFSLSSLYCSVLWN